MNTIIITNVNGISQEYEFSRLIFNNLFCYLTIDDNEGNFDSMYDYTMINEINLKETANIGGIDKIELIDYGSSEIIYKWVTNYKLSIVDNYLEISLDDDINEIIQTNQYSSVKIINETYENN